MKDLFLPADWAVAAKLVERVDVLHTDRLGAVAAGDQRAAVRDSALITDLIDHATPAVLRAALVQTTTPELRSVPVVLAAPGQSVLHELAALRDELPRVACLPGEMQHYNGRLDRIERALRGER